MEVQAATSVSRVGEAGRLRGSGLGGLGLGSLGV